MDDVHDLLKQYINEVHAGEDPDARAYLERVEGRDRALLQALIDEYLARAPRREWDADAYEQSPLPEFVESLAQSLLGSAGLWPVVLPRLRARAQIKRADLVAQLAERLGAQSKQDKVADYYNQMEHGQLPAQGVSDTVLEALGRIVGQSAEMLRQAGSAVAPGGPDAEQAVAFTRVAPRQARDTDVTAPGVPAAGAEKPAEASWDEVDRLFRAR